MLTHTYVKCGVASLGMFANLLAFLNVSHTTAASQWPLTKRPPKTMKLP